jgi:antitoxin (DNA-binding transcriptional repressor) of toxin-antitoxin stability system
MRSSRAASANPTRVGRECATMCYMSSKAGTVGVRELRQNLSVHLDRVKRGQTLKVTEHGRAVAELRPIPAETDDVARLVSEGRIQLAPRSPSALPRPLKLRPKRAVSSLLDELREDTI